MKEPPTCEVFIALSMIVQTILLRSFRITLFASMVYISDNQVSFHLCTLNLNRLVDKRREAAV